MKFKILLTILALSVVASSIGFFATNSEANFFDFFRGGNAIEDNKKNKSTEEAEISECGKSIAEFKFFLKDAKICKRDSDCMIVDAICPLGCRYYINQNFEDIIEKRIDKVAEECSGRVCSYKCPKVKIRPICVKNKCQVFSSKM